MDRRSALKLGLAALGGAVCPNVLAKSSEPPKHGHATIVYRDIVIEDALVNSVESTAVYGNKGTMTIGCRTTLKFTGQINRDQISEMNDPQQPLTIEFSGDSFFDIPPGAVDLATCVPLATIASTAKCQIVFAFNQAAPARDGQVGFWWRDDVDQESWMRIRHWIGKWTPTSPLRSEPPGIRIERPPGLLPPLENGFLRRIDYYVQANGEWVDFNLLDREIFRA